MSKRFLNSAIASSGVVQKIVPPEVKELLTSLKKLNKRILGKKAAKDIDTNIIRIVLKMKVVMDEKKVSAKEFLKADQPLRQALTLLSKLFAVHGRKTSEELRPHFQKVEEHLKDVGTVLTGLCQGKMKPKNVNRITDTLKAIGSVSFLEKAWSNQEYYDDLFNLVNAMDQYTAFNWYIDE